MPQDYTHDMKQPSEANSQATRGQELRVTGARYCPARSAKQANIYVELDVNPDLNPANIARTNAAHENLDGGSLHIDASIDEVATERLRERSGTTAHVVEGGYAIAVSVDLSAAGRGDRLALTAAQADQLPALVNAIDSCLPHNERQHAQNLALLVAQQIPARSDVVETVDRLTLREIIDHHEKKMEAYEAFAAVRLAQRSFPQHPSAALEHPHHTSPAPVRPAHSGHRSGPSIDR